MTGHIKFREMTENLLLAAVNIHHSGHVHLKAGNYLYECDNIPDKELTIVL